ncbi:MAG: hypothetical protein WBA43_22290 [Elainellaceae cyanobacterium]
MLFLNTLQDDFQQEESMDVRPYLDSEDGGWLDETAQPTMPTVFILLVSIFTFFLIYRSFISISSSLGQESQKNEGNEQTFISELKKNYPLNRNQKHDNLSGSKTEVEHESKSKQGFIGANNSKSPNDPVNPSPNDKELL